MVNKVRNLDKLNQMNIYQMNKNVQDKLLTGVKVFSKSYKKTKGKKMTENHDCLYKNENFNLQVVLEKSTLPESSWVQSVWRTMSIKTSFVAVP